MKDRFKFRVWDKQTKKMYISKDVVRIDFFAKTVTVQYWVGKRSSKQLKLRFEDVVLMQCTGLKDKNGVLIYEGDIIQFCINHVSDICWIEWQDKSSMFIKYRTYEPKQPYRLHSQIPPMVKVIGNIYENPEILKEEVAE